MVHENTHVHCKIMVHVTHVIDFVTAYTPVNTPTHCNTHIFETIRCLVREELG